MSVFALLVCGTFIFCYERYYRGPGQEILFGTWRGTLDWHGSDAYFQFSADHTFSVWDRAWFDTADKKPEFVTKGRWYAGGRFLYLRYPPEFRPDGNWVEFWYIDDISPQELRMRYWRDGGIHVFHRVDSVATRASNQAMQRTASKAASDVWSVCHRRSDCMASAGGLAVADLVSR
jgi:hypothetical protein